MNEKELISFFLTTVVPIVSLIIAIFKGITMPINKLKEELIEFKLELKNTKEHNVAQDLKIDKITNDLEEDEKLLTNHEIRIKHLESKDCEYLKSKERGV